MCGIVGLRRLDGRPADRERLAAMAATMEHRGPDDHGAWTDGPVGLAHGRLAIIDVAGSRQPAATPDDRYHLVFNGEILNYRQLRSEIRYPFRTDGDTETLLALYERYGARAAARLRGQFAFAAYDRLTGVIELVRDPLGILPLYYYADSEVVAFASEVKALLPVIRHLEVDTSAIGHYLRRRAVPAPATLFRGVRKVRPGHALRISPSGAISEIPYWRLDAEPCPGLTDAEGVALVASALESSVADNLVADVPVGALLSGGLDSSLISALAMREAGALHTFSAGFGDRRYDELPHARRVSAFVGTEHHEVVVRAEDFVSLWSTLTWHRDAPLSEPADIAVFRLAELARGHVKAVLSGEGSDELFAGYPKHRFDAAVTLLARTPRSLRRRVVDAVEPYARGRARIALRAAGAVTERERFTSWFAPFSPAECDGLGVAVEDREVDVDLAGDRLTRMLLWDVHAWLPDNLLERGDRMTMAASVELRPPFLHPAVVSAAFALPSRMKVRGRVGKWVLRQVARPLLPAEIIDRPKVGFRVPLDAWFRGGLHDMARDVLLGSQSFVGQALERNAIAELLRRHEHGANEEIRIWTLLCLEVWHERFFGSAIATTGSVAPAASRKG